MRCVLAAAVVFTGVAGVSGFAPAPLAGAARRGMRLHMQLDVPPPPQLLSVPVAAQQAAALPRQGMLSRSDCTSYVCDASLLLCPGVLIPAPHSSGASARLSQS